MPPQLSNVSLLTSGFRDQLSVMHTDGARGQESGRAGRDGLPARSIMLYDIADRERTDYILGVFALAPLHSLHCQKARVG